MTLPYLDDVVSDGAVVVRFTGLPWQSHLSRLNTVYLNLTRWTGNICNTSINWKLWQLFKYNLHLYDDIVVCYNMLTIFSHCTIQILTIAVHASHNSTYFTFSCKYFPVVIYLSAYHTRVYHQVSKCHHVCVRDRGKRDNEQKKEVTSSTSLHAVEKSLAFQIKFQFLCNSGKNKNTLYNKLPTDVSLFS